ncbi:GTPase HflX [Alicyclobacillus sp.]|uniref:GTPase HflX n=1 Tax=Alicyclobacillus sp. TaxID=61169 RepID=UPI0025C6DB7B|nr:GTPase HflX [Alicyclobacillus sp.]MCL6516553.1 GTPase HflX [Alicyclobacillus sp.]
MTRVVLGVRRVTGEPERTFSERVEELRGLCEASGAEVCAVCVQSRDRIDAALYLGRGKIEEIRQQAEACEAELVIFDGELSPAQVRNLEAALDRRVMDRTQLILDIFALRARTREGRLQVEIAQLQYLLPRLTGRGVELSRLGGGIGTRGPGETRLEMDRRRIRERIDRLRQQLSEVRRTREVQRARRSAAVPLVALVGYTNAGKTTLLARWTKDRGAGGVATGHDRLFDTLDPVARRVRSLGAGELVLMDTVGFVQDLPHLLVDAFRATLEEVRAADLIVHVVDATAPVEQRLATTYRVLGEIGALDKPVLTWFNKMDQAGHRPAPDRQAVVSLYGSAASGWGLAELYETVDRLLALDPVEVRVTGPLGEEAVWREIARAGAVTAMQDAGAGEAEAVVRVPRRLADRLCRRILARSARFHVMVTGGRAN